MKIATIIARILLGLIFVVFGSNAFLHFLPMPPLPQGVAGGYFYAFFSLGGGFVICGVPVICGGGFFFFGCVCVGGGRIFFCLSVKFLCFFFFLWPGGSPP